ncbi:hypothetical protein TDB9533_00226 [Thalassocella blandensis]|nr:hypothetical protein TDB9533_00226 [Thalassocella blandensis]
MYNQFCLGKTPVFFVALLQLAGVTLAPAAIAQNDFFADIEVSNDDNAVDETKWHYKGYVQQKLKYGIDTPDQQFQFSRDEAGLTQVRTDIFNEITYRQTDNLNWVISAKIEIDALEWESGTQQWELKKPDFFLKDAYVDWVFGNDQWLRVGHQLFAWGESEMLAISDVMSPYDTREFSQTELRDLREQVPALLYSFPIAGGKLSFVSTLDAGHNRYARSNEEFSPDVIPSTIMLQEQDPEKRWEAAIKYDYFLNGGDLRILLADVNDNNLTPGLDSNFNVFLEQHRVQVLAVAANRVIGSFQFKTEVGLRKGQQINIGIEEDQLRAMLGLEYTGFNDWLFSIEADTIQGQKVSYDDRMFSEPTKTDTYGGNLHIQNTAWNERLTQNWWYFHMLNDDGNIFRWDASYDLNDSWELSAALVIYNKDADEGQLYPYRDNDTFNLAAKFSF